MKISEFKAWFSGFKESFPEGTPTAAQLKRVIEMIDKVEPDVIETGGNPLNTFPPFYLPSRRQESWPQPVKVWC